ncbi:oligopeptide transport system ATP-binding protein [Tranquillimonas rosea]|uniref:Oligopeptide transport system ATP-binding protein n=1 Tax=Tranquillimonas rosea TaxID=641238 RepID=A0A1H9VR02_9RHOB|nr:oligopeptide/dipeptide ABC transporter ATP-binding protein [Tranquillimonas rosea]SES24019.1 oligopeptide transport system ATP-binding protein [Tranquillimonas rosea]
MPLLDVDTLGVTFDTPDGTVNAVNDLSFSVDPGETLAIVGESGSGKSQTVFGVMGLLARNGRATGRVSFEGKALSEMSDAEFNRVRGDAISMIFQDPMTSLNPYIRVGDQMIEVLTLHKGLGRRAARDECVRMLDAVRIPDARARLDQYPHEFSGGMRQRIMIAMALLCRPKLLIADEPTTALDVTVQAQIMKLLGDIREEFGTAMILITHDLGIVADSCDRTLVMYGGRAMEEGPTQALFESPSHPYTTGLLKAVPRLDIDQPELQTIPGEPPDMSRLGPGCPFAPRCLLVREVCRETMPPLVSHGALRRACHADPAEVT